MPLKLACADFSFPLLTHDHALDVVAMLGFQGVDIGLFEGRSHLQPSDVSPRLAAAARDLSDRVQARGLAVADVFFQATSFADRAANHPDAAERRRGRELFLAMLEFTLRCNAAHLTGLPGLHWEGESVETSLDRAAEELAWRAEQARQLGVTFSVEPHLGSLTPTPEAALRLLERTPGLTLTLDYCHFTYQGIADDAVEPLVAHASHFHARAASKGRLQAPLKENTIDYGRVLRACARVGYTGYLAVEYVWIDWERCNEVDNLSETILLRDLLHKESSVRDS
jgi:sugar phosphate isomerase/epimerase